MKLNFEQIKSITTGAVKVSNENDGFHFQRFTDKQRKLYKSVNTDHYKKCFCTAGIRFSFKTDSKKMYMNIDTQFGSSRTYFSVDVFVNGVFKDAIDNYSNMELPKMYTIADCPLGDFSKTIDLGEGEKEVCVYLPWSVNTVVKEIVLDDNAVIKPIKRDKTLLAFGDSITHGYDALRPSNRYISKLSDMLGAEEYNKAIGGERFFPDLAMLKEDFIPDYITDVREFYGSVINCRAFYAALSKNYPDTKIFAVTPIWRKDTDIERQFGNFETVEKHITDAVKDIGNVTVISGYDFVPKKEKYFADFRLHPNDEGFEHYANNLYSAIEKFI